MPPPASSTRRYREDNDFEKLYKLYKTQEVRDEERDMEHRAPPVIIKGRS